MIITPGLRKKRNQPPPSELKSAELKYRSLVESRNELNDEAKAIREQRDTLNESKKSLLDEMKELKKKREGYVKLMREHKKMRNEYQKKAKELIEFKRNKLSKSVKSLPEEIEVMRVDIQMLEKKQQTVPLSIEAENDLLDTIRTKMKDLNNMMQLLGEQKQIDTEVKELNDAIDDLFKKGDEEHEKVTFYYNESQKCHEKISHMGKEISSLNIESNKKHEKYIKIRERANEFHEKAQEMRQKVLAIKKESWEEKKKARAEIDAVNKAARDALLNKKKLDEAADKALEELLKKGKIEKR